MTDPEAKAQIVASMYNFAMVPNAIARAIAFAIELPANVDVGAFELLTRLSPSVKAALLGKHESVRKGRDA